MPFMKQELGRGGGLQRARVLGLWGKMIACDVSQVVILGQEIAGSLFHSSQQKGSGWGKTLGLIRLVWGRDGL